MTVNSERIKRDSQAVWRSTPAGPIHALEDEPGTKQFFDRLLERHGGYELSWLWEVIPLSSFDGRDVLEIGCGAGCDAFASMKAGARYTAALACRWGRRWAWYLVASGENPNR